MNFRNLTTNIEKRLFLDIVEILGLVFDLIVVLNKKDDNTIINNELDKVLNILKNNINTLSNEKNNEIFKELVLILSKYNILN